MKPSYAQLLRKSLTDFTENPVILIPLLVSLILFLGMVAIIALELLITVLFFGISLASPTLSFSLIIASSFFFILNLGLALVIRAYISSMNVGMLKSIAVRGKTNMDDMWKSGRKYFVDYLLYLISLSALILVPFIVLTIISGLFFMQSKTGGTIIFIVLLVLFFLYMAFVGISVFFIRPMLVSEKTGIIGLFRTSFNYLFKKPGHVLLTWVISLGVAIAIGSVITAVTLPFESAFLPFIAATVFIRVIVNILVKIYLDIFRFNSYFSFNPEKKH